MSDELDTSDWVLLYDDVKVKPWLAAPVVDLDAVLRRVVDDAAGSQFGFQNIQARLSMQEFVGMMVELRSLRAALPVPPASLRVSHNVMPNRGCRHVLHVDLDWVPINDDQADWFDAVLAPSASPLPDNQETTE